MNILSDIKSFLCNNTPLGRVITKKENPIEAGFNAFRENFSDACQVVSDITENASNWVAPKD